VDLPLEPSLSRNIGFERRLKTQKRCAPIGTYSEKGCEISPSLPTGDFLYQLADTVTVIFRVMCRAAPLFSPRQSAWSHRLPSRRFPPGTGNRNALLPGEIVDAE
jgi:hypothetical protein